jgi:hypothetical protein
VDQVTDGPTPPDDHVWRLARARVLGAFDRQLVAGIASHGQPLPVDVPGMVMADERLQELVDAIIYETADLLQRAALETENRRLRALLAEHGIST